MESEADRLRKEILLLTEQLEAKQQQLNRCEKSNGGGTGDHILCRDEIVRYSRQIIMPNMGVRGQVKLKKSSALIVGMGGLGCPAASYLVGAGIGTLGIIDYDTVDYSNLHRQLLYKGSSVGMPKVEAARHELSSSNRHIDIVCYNIQLNSQNCLEIIKKYDVVLDATDNVATRYLLNDACVIAGKPLVSGSALQMEGQLTVYNYLDGPCYRCLFPNPPPPETVTNCGDGGVLGCVPGVIGTLQALEAIKICLNNTDGVLSGKLLLFDATNCGFRNVKIRIRQPKCIACSDEYKPMLKLIDYEQYCGMKANDKDTSLNILSDIDRITVDDYSRKYINGTKSHVLVDVRSFAEFEMCKLPNSINIHIDDVLNNKIDNSLIDDWEKNNYLVVMICRRGNDSQRAVSHLKSEFPKLKKVKDIVGGLHAWGKKIDQKFPIY